MTFKDAFLRLEEIEKLLQSNELLDIDEIVALQQEAKKLYDECTKQLKKVEAK